MASQVEICNMALVLIGDQVIEAITDDNDRAVICNRFFDDTRDAVLRAHPWGFAKQRKELAVDAEAPAFGSTESGWDYQFTLPTDPWCLRVLEVAEEFPGQKPYSIEGRKLLTDESSIKILYVAQITNTGLFDALFMDALAARLAMNFAMALTKTKTLLELAANLYKLKMDEAMTIDGQESTKKEFYNTTLTAVRQ